MNRLNRFIFVLTFIFCLTLALNADAGIFSPSTPQKTSLTRSEDHMQGAVKEETITRELDMLENYMETPKESVSPGAVDPLTEPDPRTYKEGDSSVLAKNAEEPGAPEEKAAIDFKKTMMNEGMERTTDTAETVDKTKKKRVEYELGTEFSVFNYKEPTVMKDEGILWGINGAMTAWLPIDREDLALMEQAGDNTAMVMMRLEGSVAYGQVDYTSGATGEIKDIDDIMFEIRGLVGYECEMSKRTTVVPFTGIGYRYLNDDTGGRTSTTGASGYERESNYYYSPIGAMAETELSPGWFVGSSVEYDIFWFGWQKSHLEDVSSGYSLLENDQKRGYGLRGSLWLRKKGEKMDFIIEPFFKYWDIDESEKTDVTYAGAIVGYGYEPQNNSEQYGVKTSIKF